MDLASSLLASLVLAAPTTRCASLTAARAAWEEGRELHRDCRVAEAIQAFDCALAAPHPWGRAYRDWALASLDAADADALRARLDAHSKDPRDRLRLGWLETERGNHAEAEQAFGEAAALAPASPWPHVGLAYLRLRQLRHNEAARAVAAALGRSPDLADALYVEGRIHLIQGRLQAARETAETIERTSPGDPLAGDLLQRIARRTHIAADRVELLERVVSDYPALETAYDALSNLNAEMRESDSVRMARLARAALGAPGADPRLDAAAWSVLLGLAGRDRAALTALAEEMSRARPFWVSAAEDADDALRAAGGGATPRALVLARAIELSSPDAVRRNRFSGCPPTVVVRDAHSRLVAGLRMRLAHALIEAGQAEKARTQLEAVLDTAPRQSADAAELMARVAATRGDTAEETRWLAQAFSYSGAARFREQARAAWSRLPAPRPAFDDLLARARILAAPLAPALEFTPLGPGTTSLAELRGKVIVLAFWATWCKPCLAELPSLEAFHRRHQKDERIRVLAVNVDYDRGIVERFLRSRKLELPIALAEEEQAIDFGVRSIPLLLVVDPEGRIRRRHLGAVEDGDLTTRLGKWVDEVL